MLNLDTQDHSNPQECASIPIYLFAAPPSAVHQFSVANIQVILLSN